MNDLPIEKQFTHQKFCEQIKDIKDVNVIRAMLEDLHLSYLSQQVVFVKIAKQEFMGGI